MASIPLFWIFSFLFYFALLTAAVFGLIYYLRKRKSRKVKWTRRKIFHTFSYTACIIIAAASWMLNLGWFRVILTWIPIPIIHTIFFIKTNNRTANFLCTNDATNKTKVLSVLSHITYLLTYLLFPDFSDYGPAYVFFSLIRYDNVAYFADIAIISFVANIVIMILQFGDSKPPKKIGNETESNESIE